MIEGITAGVDWITATLPTTSPTGELWVERGLSVLDEIAKGGYDLYERTMQGYYGISAGNCFVGSRDDTHIVQMTGYHANDHFTSIYRPDLHVARIDVQLTAKFDVMPLLLAQEAYDAISTSNQRIPDKTRRKCTIIAGSDGGATFYLGSRASDQFGRIYNKEVQSDDPVYKRSWRYEVVFRNDLASDLAGRCPAEATARAQWAVEVVAAWFHRRGVDCAGLDAVEGEVLPLVRTLPTDIERQLKWLEHQVGPTVKRLLEAGYGDTLRVLLGME